ncbi:hypothetical protein V496_06673 [Pseudogymnoascus sp. VKM F-4515 (FW-2607)]|nr:hypothetical protein V496_06673 [Pseudogymnoascus sp. VKM F-4515 (FW-2607)]KFY93710.1 hypothetical protein V498_04303 [Pseudogymnoascus sp. VKM F-4517 (FW-2822)]
MSLLQDWLPPSPENWTLIVNTFTYFPVITAVQWLTAYYPMGKTSTTSCLNIPGKLAWMLMELPAPLLLVYTMAGLRDTLPPPPKENLSLAGIYVTHYIYRALLAPLLNPSMSPIHPIIILGAWVFNTLNALSLGGHLAGLGPILTTRLTLGLPIWALGFAGTIAHDEILRRGRRAASKPGGPAKAVDRYTVPDGHGGEKTYVLPSGGLFRWVLSPHYLCEWIEWVGFYIATGGALPARNFVAAEVATMLPRAIATRKWYVEKFSGAEGRWAVLPGLV